MEKESNRDVYAGLISKVKSLGASVKNALVLAQILTRSIPVIIEQPVDAHVTDSQTAYLRVTAENIASYQWQYCTATDPTWKNSTGTGNKTERLTVSSSYIATRYKNFYRCKLTGVDNSVIYSNIVRIIREET